MSVQLSSILADHGFLREHGFDPGCGCSSCLGHVEDVNAGLAFVADRDDATADRFAGTTAANGKPIWTADQAAAYLNRSGASWISGPNPGVQGDSNLQEITFGFHVDRASLARNGYVYTFNGATYNLAEYDNFAMFNDAQKDAARFAMTLWDDVVAVSFRESNIDDADIAFGNLASAPQTQAYARLPFGTVSSNASVNAQARDIVGDVWVSASQASNFQLDPGGYGLNTLVHEIGHSLGLSHPGAYNFGPNFTATYANGAEYYQDVRNYSIMSYWNPRDIGVRDFNWNVMAIAYGSAPMIHDILAVQKMYGADTTTRTGDTVYGFNSTADRDVFDFTVNEAPTVAIWDAGGNDTLDASGYRTDQEINLNPGSLSSIGGVTYQEALERLTFEQVNANRAELGYAPTSRATYDANMAALARNPSAGRLVDNVGIAYGATIENAVGGSGNDLIISNAVANRLDGGSGTDTASYREALGGVTASLRSGLGSAGEAAGDVYLNIENLEGSAFADNLTGDNGDNILTGLGGDDIMYGGRGADTLRGGLGNDTLFGDSGDDVLLGDDGDDRLIGLDGGDTMVGGAGNDVLRGGGGYDTLAGGAGRDEFAVRQVEAVDASTATGSNAALREFNQGSYGSVSQWVKIGDLQFTESDFVRVTGFSKLFNAAGAAAGTSFASGRGDYVIDSQQDVDQLAAFLRDNPNYGAVFEYTYGQDITSFVLVDDFGRAHVIELGGVHPQDDGAGAQASFGAQGGLLSHNALSHDYALL